MHVLDGEGRELRRLGPLPQPVQQVAWAGAAGDDLVACTPAALHTWTQGGSAEGPVLPSPSPEAPYLRIAASPQAPMLAASSADREVRRCGLVGQPSTAAACSNSISMGWLAGALACGRWPAPIPFVQTVCTFCRSLQVRCWDVAALLSRPAGDGSSPSSSSPGPPQPLRLREFESQVRRNDVIVCGCFRAVILCIVLMH